MTFLCICFSVKKLFGVISARRVFKIGGWNLESKWLIKIKKRGAVHIAEHEHSALCSHVFLSNKLAKDTCI